MIFLRRGTLAFTHRMRRCLGRTQMKRKCIANSSGGELLFHRNRYSWLAFSAYLAIQHLVRKTTLFLNPFTIATLPSLHIWLGARKLVHQTFTESICINFTHFVKRHHCWLVDLFRRCRGIVNEAMAWTLLHNYCSFDSAIGRTATANLSHLHFERTLMYNRR